MHPSNPSPSVRRLSGAIVLDSKCTALDGRRRYVAVVSFIPASEPLHWKDHTTQYSRFQPFVRASCWYPETPEQGISDNVKALLHLAIQRMYIGDESNKAAFKSISSRCPIMDRHCEGARIWKHLGIIDRILIISNPWTGKTSLSSFYTTHKWATPSAALEMSSGKANRYPMISRSSPQALQLKPPSLATIVAGCLLIAGSVLGIKFHIDDLLVSDKKWVYLRAH